ncbi:hypothetical protein GGQ87_001405 [Brevundimonas alba]|uniref:Terminase small subunit n=1 Tax=Brevundimonas alba TaxID=74314 RepID=A0A7X5YK73_9CAUL|nr:hypothetical protein [Brevundimonas alba]NJC41147.1 hypothetical protein [Brevundimonas alba]
MAKGTQITATRPRRGRHAAPEDVWRRVRDAYLDGMSAPDVCRLYGVGVTALRSRAARELWRRRDQAWAPPPNELDVSDEGILLEDRAGGDLDKVEFYQLSFVAHRRSMRAVMRGDAAEALRWRKVRIAMDEEQAEIDRVTAQHEAIRYERAGWAELAAYEAQKAAAADAAAATDAVDDAFDAANASDASHSSDASDAVFHSNSESVAGRSAHEPV